MAFKPCFLVMMLLISVVSAQQYDSEDYQQPAQQQQRQEQQPDEEGALPGPNNVDASVPEPPSQIPETSFVCEGKPYEPGMYADEETGCRVYHMCFNGRKEDFICGTGTVFNQETLTCDYPANVDCASSASFYDSNSEFGKGAPEPSGDSGAKPAGRQPAPRPQGRVPQPRPQPGQGQQPSFGGGQEQDYDEAPAQRPQAPRPQAPRPQAPRPAPRPQAPRPAPAQRPSKQQPPRQQPRPVAPSYPAPRSKSSPPRQQPVRPIVQQSEQQNLDYEPTNQQFARRSGWAPAAPAAQSAAQVSPVTGRRGVASFRPQSQRWQMMSANY